MCQQPNQQQAATAATAPASEIQTATLQLQIAQTRSAAEFNSSAAGQLQRQFEAMQRIGKAYAESTIVPKAYQGNIGNCIISLEIAHRMSIPPLMVMQNLYIVNGNPSWSSKFLVATVNTSGRYTALRYRKRLLGKLGKVKYNSHEWVTTPEGKREKTIVLREFDATGIDNIECVAYATEKSTGEVLESDPVTIEMAIKEGWYTKDGSKWPTMPMLMLSYRAAAFWQRTYAPEISMGFRTVEEEVDITDTDYEEVQPTRPAAAPQPTAAADEAKDKLRQQRTAATAKSTKPQQPSLDMP